MANIIASGRAVFATRPETTVVFEKKIPGDYLVFACGNGGPLGIETEAFSVYSRTENGFMVRSSYGSSKSTIDYMVVKP